MSNFIIIGAAISWFHLVTITFQQRHLLTKIVLITAKIFLRLNIRTLAVQDEYFC